MSKFRTFALVNQKGGVGKTTTAVNLGTALAAMGRTALVIDLDPQGNASTGLGIERAQRENGTYEVLLGGIPAADAIVADRDTAPVDRPVVVDLAGAEIELVNAERREHRLAEALAAVAEPVRLYTDRLPAVAQHVDFERAGRGGRAAGAAADRVLCAGRPDLSGADGRAGEARLQPRLELAGHHPHHVRPP